MKQTYVLIAALAFVMGSCSTNSKKEELTVHHFETPSKEGSSLPYLFSKNNKTLLSWVEKEGDSLVKLQFSELVKGKWGEPKEIITGNDWFVNWADFPAIAENNGQFLSHVLKKSSEETFSYDVKLNLFNEQESKWKKDFLLHNDGTKTEHGFVSILPYKEDSFFVTWLDGRNTGGGSHGGGHHGAMTVRAAEVSSTGEITNEIMLDDKTCDCCQTTAAITSNGPVVIYRDRSDEEIRDMSIVRLVDGKWTTPKTVFQDNWKIAGCPVNGPKAAVLDNNLAVAWFSAANGEPKVNLVFSTDGGAHFNAPIRISEINPMGRVDVAMIDSENVLVSWMESVEDAAQIKVVKVHRSGKKSEPVIVAALASTRSTGFPQMELVDDKVYFAWTSVTNEITAIKTAYVLLNKF